VTNAHTIGKQHLNEITITASMCKSDKSVSMRKEVYRLAYTKID